MSDFNQIDLFSFLEEMESKANKEEDFSKYMAPPGRAG